MSEAAARARKVELDLSDVKRRVGQEVGGGELHEPCSATDIRRWVMAMDYPNPIHWDRDFAAASKFGGIVAPQSFAAGGSPRAAKSKPSSRRWRKSPGSRRAWLSVRAQRRSTWRSWPWESAPATRW